MSFTFSSVFKKIVEYSPAANHEDIFSELFFSYYEYAGKPDTPREYTISKILSGEKHIDRNGQRYYANPKHRENLISDIECILQNISEKFDMCDKLRELIISDGMNDKDRESLLRSYPENEDDIAAFIANVIIFTLNRPNRKESSSPDISDRIILPSTPPCEMFSGRKRELQAFAETLETHDKIFLYGIAGIGKSEFAKMYIKDRRKSHKNILYLQYKTNLRSTIADISFKDDRDNDTFDARFKRHSEYLKLLKSDSLIIIDGFNIEPDSDDYFKTLMTYNCKIIFVRNHHSTANYNVFDFELKEMDTDELILIATKSDIKETADTLNQLFSTVYNHTLACELIMILMDRNAYSGEDLLEILSKNNVTPNINDDILISEKGNAKYEAHIKMLFDLFSLTEKQKEVLRYLSLVPAYGIGDKYFKALASLDDFNPVNELDELGLIYYVKGTLSVHSLIADVAVSELAPDLNNCRAFLEGIREEARYLVDDPTNRARKLILLPVADKVISSVDISVDKSYYVDFMNCMCTYAQVFSDTTHMSLYLTEVDKYINNNAAYDISAVHYMSMANLARANNDDNGAIRYIRKAAECLPDTIPSNAPEKIIALAINIYNSLFVVHIDNMELEKARKYGSKAEKLVNRMTTADNSIISFEIGMAWFNLLTENLAAAERNIGFVLSVYAKAAPDSYDYANALKIAAAIYRQKGDVSKYREYLDLSDKIENRLKLECKNTFD